MHPVKNRVWLAIAAGISALLICGTAHGATIISKAPNTEIVIGLGYSEMEFENPLGGSEMIHGYRVIDWRDADYQSPPPWYDDWTVSHPGVVDGWATEIWLRNNSHSMWTTTQVPSKIVSIHLAGDDNDGIAQIMVDGQEVATLDMYNVAAQSALVIVKALPSTTHTIRVNDLGPGSGGAAADDVAVFGAAALTREFEIKWNQPPQSTIPANLFYGWNEESIYGGPQIVADDWLCTTNQPVTSIRWWGSFIGWQENVLPPQNYLPDRFVITIWTDVPPGQEPFSHPGTVLWRHDVLAPLVQHVGLDYDPRNQSYESCFLYSVDLPPEKYFCQNSANNLYWVSIAAAYDSNPIPDIYQWGWKTRPRDPASLAPDDAVRIAEPTAPDVGMLYLAGDPIFWPTPAESWDLAFELQSAHKWAQPPDLTPMGIDVNCSRQFMPPVQFLLADDWQCTSAGAVTNIDVWCSWYQDEYPFGDPGNVQFFLSIHSDIPGDPSMPGPTLWAQMFDPGQFQFIQVSTNSEGWMNPPDQYTPFGDTNCWRYSFFIPPGEFIQEGTPANPVIYWLNVQAQPLTPNAQIGWKTSWCQWNDNAVWVNAVEPYNGPWNPLIYPPGHPKAGLPLDLAFAINSEPISIETKWSQPPEPYAPPDGFDGWNELSMHGGEQIAADDWVCTTNQPVTDIHWWGSFIGWNWSELPLSSLPAGFHFAIWTDVPVGIDPFSHPGQVIWETYCENYSVEFVGWDFDPRNPDAAPEACFFFECYLPENEWFYQDPGANIYWLSIAPVYDLTPPQFPWGWKTTPRIEPQSPDDGVRIFDPTAPTMGIPYLFGEPIEFPPGISWDLAFSLTTLPDFTDDFGDAPDPPYPTFIANTGAQHTTGALILGATIDAELDGQPNATATGDDTSGLPDEDGVVFNTMPLIPGQNAQVTVTLGTNVTNAYLSAWVDFNGDGSWATAGDQIFVAQPLAFGANVLSFPVPSGATEGIATFSRWRLHTNSAGIAYTGAMPSGEVEDHMVSIGVAPKIKWAQPPHPPAEGFDAESDLWWTSDPPQGSKWQQVPDVNLPALHAHEWPPDNRIILANDWICEGGMVTDLHWWGAIEPSPGTLSGFNLSIHSSTTGLPCLPIDPPLWMQFVPITMITVSSTGLVNSTGEPIILYEYDLPVPFAQTIGQRYWLNISATSANIQNPVFWKWQQATPPVLCDAAEKSEPPLPGVWQTIGSGNIELAFRVTSQLLIEPLNKVVADDFVSDGRPINAVRWWGSYFDDRYAPGGATDPDHVMDGWLISFHWANGNAANPTCPPDSLFDPPPTVLGVYFAPLAAVQIEPQLNYLDCQNKLVFRYSVDLSQCCLICAEIDPRTGGMPAQPAFFAEEGRLPYWLDIQAITGATWIPTGQGTCELVPNSHLPPEDGGHFWGWHTSPGPDDSVNLCGALNTACTGKITDFTTYPPACWQYGQWTKQPWQCPVMPPDPIPPVHMAFELITMTAATPLAPWVVEHPVTVTTCEGYTATFKVEACGTAPLSYQWRHDGSNVGGNSKTLVVSPVTLADAGNYDVVVSNSVGNTISTPATLTVHQSGTGDVDGNGSVDGLDTQAWIDEVLNWSPGSAPSPAICASDMDVDGDVDTDDLPLFVTALLTAP